MRHPVILLILILCWQPGVIYSTQPDKGITGDENNGKALYNYYCYQCHGYSGDGKTLASTFLVPAPRNFTSSDSSVLTFSAMVDAVTHGRSGTGMVSFSRVLSAEEIKSVIAYIRSAFMQQRPAKAPYHSTENGWTNHERYRPAFPFATGEISLDTAWESLDDEQRTGKQLYMNACISCHDRAKVTNEGPIWELRALSYPRKHYSHKHPEVDLISNASPYAIHDKIPDVDHVSESSRRGEQLFQKNCAFCHAADGTGRNWIGSFLEPRPRDLTGSRVKNMDNRQLQQVIRNGITGSSMPAWKNVLNESQVTDIISYIRQGLMTTVIAESGSEENS